VTDSIPLPPQPALLGDFPSCTLGIDVELWRIHLSHREPHWFGQDRYHRFDPQVGDVRFGTCYVGASAEAAFLETLGRTSNGLIDEADVLARSLTELSLTSELRLAGLTDPEVRDGVPFRGVGGHVRSPVVVGQVRGAAGNASPVPCQGS